MGSPVCLVATVAVHPSSAAYVPEISSSTSMLQWLWTAALRCDAAVSAPITGHCSQALAHFRTNSSILQP